MTKTEIAMTLERETTRLHAEALDNGHNPHPWSQDETYVAHTACRTCGKSMVVRVYPDHVFTSGLLRACEA